MGLADQAPLNIESSISLPVSGLSLLGRLGAVAFLSVAIHGLGIFGVSFKAPEMNKSAMATSLEVVLVNSKSASRPVKADALAQANLDGGGNTPMPNVGPKARCRCWIRPSRNRKPRRNNSKSASWSSRPSA